MCGIVGLYRKNRLVAEDSENLEVALEAIRTRGPDDSGMWKNPHLAMGHQRLSILDVEGGQQPWVDSTTGLVLVYNGEIYNYAELKAELLAKQHSFRSGCDTEVLLHAYLEWGEDCLSRLRGMFAFALFDPRNEKLWLVRDRMGVKPLYYRKEGADWIFASNLAAIMALQSDSPRWNPSAVAHYMMTARIELGSATLFNEVACVEPGSFLRIDLKTGKSEAFTYWEFPRLAPSDKLDVSFDAAVDKVQSLLRSSIKEQLLSSDVPVGGFLSGGLDSAILCGEVQVHQDAFTAYSIGYGRTGYNEWEAMQLTAELNHLKWTRLVADEEAFWDDCECLIGSKGTALSTPNEVPIYQMARAFGRDCKVSLTGEGADEIFGGYSGPTFCAFDYDRSQGAAGGVSAEALLRGYGRSSFGSRREHFLLANTWIRPDHLKQLCPGLSLEGGGIASVLAWYDQRFAEMESLSTFDAYMHLHARVNLEGLLNRLDSSTMSASVEGRVPFTDHRLAEYLFTLPDAYKMRLQPQLSEQQTFGRNSFELDAANCIETKRLLRHGFKNLVDPHILRRKKVSFPVPFIELLQGAFRPQLQELLDNAPATASLLGSGDLCALLKEISPNNGLITWLLMNLAMTERKWNVQV